MPYGSGIREKGFPQMFLNALSVRNVLRDTSESIHIVRKCDQAALYIRCKVLEGMSNKGCPSYLRERSKWEARMDRSRFAKSDSFLFSPGAK